MDAQLVVIVAGALLLAAIVGALFFMRGYKGRFTFDTAHGTRPRAAEGEGATTDLSLKGRLKLLTAAVGAALAALGVKLWSMQMVSADYYEQLSERNRTRTVTTPAPRGRILDRDGVELVTNRPTLSLAAYRDLAERPLVIRHLSNLLGVPSITVMRSILDYSQSAQSLHVIASDVRRSIIAYIQEHPTEFEGVHVIEGSMRTYPYGSLACHVLGYTGAITQEQLDEQKNREQVGTEGKVVYESGDIVGHAGIEAQYEELLQGIRGERTVKVDSTGKVVSQAGEVPSRAGSDIKLTLSLKIQQACEAGLAFGIERAHAAGQAAPAGACLCMDVTNGEILGMASFPNFDPSVFIGGVSNEDWERLNGEKSGTPMLNRAIAGQYMSASTIKVLSSLAALEFGAYTTSQTSLCTGWWTGLGEAAGRWCYNHDGHGIQNLRQGIVNSCDAVFYDIGKSFFYDASDSEGMQKVFRRWGLGSLTDIDLPGEFAGRIPDAAWKREFFSDWDDADRTWNPGDLLNIAIGQGDILVTPLQMAQVYAGVAMRGVEYVPHLFHSALAPDGSVATTYEPRELRRVKSHNDDDLELVRGALEGVIYEETDAITRHFTSLDVRVAGKTGTGEKGGQDDYAWFICYAPADDPKYLVAVVIEQGGFGSASAMPAARTVLGAIYDSPDTAAYGGDRTR
ncbi:penicillin-binding protein 2 [Collinsella sp. AGMB00827]|uniref:Penicillin-binding protein 2 n=1 Tax=Collinsella ureilytica TaxID=2869515 RepID=A0ABS7MLB5_9ACTN|nr:penicillin-binding protein 2 [Collinsella urealyticum]MBY4798067.1 penicillin-binding protein 2 [Collinsella urealyticum]